MKKLYEENSIQEVANAIRNGLKIEDTMTVAEMPHYINRLGNPYVSSIIDSVPSRLDENGDWVRPDNYEDVGQLTWENNEEVCYLSLSKSTSAPWMLGLYITASKGTQVEYGHVVNGSFISISEPELIKTNTVYVKALPVEESTLVAKITSQNYLYPISYFSFYQFTAAQAGSPINVPYYFQPVVERVGNLPYITSVAASGTSRGFGCAHMERDAIKFGHFTSLTNLSNAGAYCYNLEELDVNDIDTSHWKVTTVANMFQHCCKIKKIDLSNWNTTLWAVTNGSNMFYNCNNLFDLRIGTWDTTNWKITTTVSMFVSCQNLETIEIENWNTSNGAVTSLANMFQYCVSLKSLNLSKWDTSKGAVTTMAYTFDNCQSLKELDISTGNVSNGKPTTINYMFQYCLSLTYLDLSNWDVSSWPLATMTNTFANCRSLKHLLIDSWNTSSWALTSMSATFQYCSALLELPIENWDTHNWPLGTLTSIAGYCYNLKKLDLSKWDNTKFAITDCKTAISYCRDLEYLDVSTLGLKTVPTGTGPIFVINEVNLNLVELYPQPNINYNHNYSSIMNLSRASLLRILNSLPQASGTRTLTLGNLRAKLTIEDIAIATEKGWAVA